MTAVSEAEHTLTFRDHSGAQRDGSQRLIQLLPEGRLQPEGGKVEMAPRHGEPLRRRDKALGNPEERRQPSHLLERELEAAVEPLKSAKVLFPGHRITLVVDNSATFYALQNGFTTSDSGQAIMSWLKEGDWPHRIVLVTPGNNPADCPPRGDNAASEAPANGVRSL